jgi:nucleoside-diphosphate-sugar epimerase
MPAIASLPGGTEVHRGGKEEKEEVREGEAPAEPSIVRKARLGGSLALPKQRIMRILILGGTAFIGPHIVRELALRGHDVTIFHRGQHETVLPGNVRHVHGDFARFDEHLAALRALEPEVVVDMFPRRAEDGRRVLAFSGIARRSVVLSSCDVYLAYGRLVRTEPGDPEPVPLTEQSRLREKLSVGGENYDKISVENLARGDPKIPCTVLRLAAVYGPGDYQHRLYRYVKRMADNRPAVLIDEAQRDWRWARVYVQNLAVPIARAATEEIAIGKTYNLCDQPTHSELEWATRLAKVMDYRGEIRMTPSDLLPQSLRSDIDTRQHMILDTTAIKRDLNYCEMVDEPLALRRTIDWELANPPKDSRIEEEYPIEDAAISRLSQR